MIHSEPAPYARVCHARPPLLNSLQKVSATEEKSAEKDVKLGV